MSVKSVIGDVRRKYLIIGSPGLGVLTTLAVLSLSGGTRAAEGFALAKDGEPAATVVLAADAQESNRFAAEELRSYVKRISGAELPLATDTDKVEGPKILLGRSALTEALKLEIPNGFSRELKEEGFVIRQVGDSLVLAGNDNGPYVKPKATEPNSYTNVYKGTLFAVYEVLERLGCRWYYPGEFGEILPEKQPDLVLPKLDGVYKPSFAVRGYWYGVSKQHSQADDFDLDRLHSDMSLWYVRNRFLPYGSVLNSATDGSVMWPFRKMKTMEVDGVRQRVNTLFDEHPEYFAMRGDGTRAPDYLCLSHTGVVAIAVERALQFFRDNPQANCFGYAPPDGAPTCECDECRFNNYNLMQKEPYNDTIQDISEGFYRFLNQVAIAVQREFPDKWITSTAYSGRTRPPMATKLNDNISLHLAFLGYAQHHSFDFPGWMTQEKAALLRRWSRVNPYMVERQYYPAFQFTCHVPMPLFRVHAYNLRQIKEMGLAGAEWEGRVAFKTGLLNDYIMGKMMWDVDTDVEELIAEHNRLFYGAAAAPVGEFFDAVEKMFTQVPIEFHEEERLHEIYPYEQVIRITDELGDIEALVKDASPATRERVRFARLQADHLRAYSEMRRAEAELDFKMAAKLAQSMIDMEKEFDNIATFLVDTVMAKYDAGEFYGELGANASARGKLKQYLAKQEMIEGPRGDLVAALPVEWDFKTDPHNTGLIAGWFEPGAVTGWSKIETTRCWEGQGYQDDKLYGYDGFGWYRTSFPVPAEFKGRRIKLFIGGLNNQGWCWVNGDISDATPHHGTFHRWSYHQDIDITDQVRFGQDNELIIRVLNNSGFGGIFRRCFVYAER